MVVLGISFTQGNRPGGVLSLTLSKFCSEGGHAMPDQIRGTSVIL